jgi:hypothetical protein
VRAEPTQRRHRRAEHGVRTHWTRLLIAVTIIGIRHPFATLMTTVLAGSAAITLAPTTPGTCPDSQPEQPLGGAVSELCAYVG